MIGDLTFPDDQYMPPKLQQQCDTLLISLLVPREFGSPVLQARFRNTSDFAGRIGVLMPEATVNKDYLFQLRENDVRVSRQALAMKMIAIPQAVQKFPDVELRTHALAANAPHVLAAAFWRNGVGHGSLNYQI